MPTKENPFMNYNYISDARNKPKSVKQDAVRK